MNGTKVLGLAALGAFLALAEPAQALSLINPGAAVAVQDGSNEMMTEVHYHHGYHHRWHHWHHRHW